MNSSLNLTSDDLIGNIQKFNNYLIFKLNEQCVNINENVKEIINSTNDTSVNDTLLITTTTKTPNDDYDYAGAVVYIIVITLFYSISVLAIIRIQTKKRTDFNDYDDEDDYSNYRPETVLRRMKNENITRQVLEELRNPEIRSKLWSMYTEHRNDITVKKQNPMATINEQKRLQLIDKKLKQFYKESPDYYKTVDNSAITTSESRPMPVFKQLSMKFDDAQTKRQKFSSSRSQSVNTSSNDGNSASTSTATQPASASFAKKGRFNVVNVDETTSKV